MKTRWLSLFLALFLLLQITGAAAGIEVSDRQELVRGRVMAHVAEVAASDSTTTWTADTAIAEMIPTYDLDGGVSGYIFNLQTDGQPTGYVRVMTYGDAAVCDILQYGYDGVFMVQGQPVSGNSALAQQALICDGWYFYVRDGGRLKLATDGQDVTTYQTAIRSGYQQSRMVSRQETASLVAQASIAAPQASTATITSKYDVTGLWEDNIDGTQFVPYTQDRPYFSGYDKFCVPMAGMTLLKYWDNCRGIWPLFQDTLRDTFECLCEDMNHSNQLGVRHIDGYNGMRDYLSRSNVLTESGSDYVPTTDITWHWITTNLNADIPFILTASMVPYDGSSYIHAFVTMGYEVNTSGKYLRVLDGYSTNLSTFYRFSTAGSSATTNSYFYAAWYVRFV